MGGPHRLTLEPLFPATSFTATCPPLAPMWPYILSSNLPTLQPLPPCHQLAARLVRHAFGVLRGHQRRQLVLCTPQTMR